MSESRAIVDPEEILSYWFPPGYDTDAETFRQQLLRWFQGGSEVDREIIELFTPVLEQARRGSLTGGRTRHAEGSHSSSYWTSSPAPYTRARRWRMRRTPPPFDSLRAVSRRGWSVT